VWEFTEKNSANSETLVYPQLKNVFPVEKGRDKESQIGDEILCLACSNQVDYSRHPEMSKLAKDHRLYAAGNSKIIYVIKIMKNATPEYEDKFIVSRN
jgi:hypothetical protein